MRGQFVPEWNKSTLLKIVYPSIRQVRGATPPDPRCTMPVLGFVRSSLASVPIPGIVLHDVAVVGSRTW